MKQLFATLVLGLAVAVSSWGQCGSMAYNPVTRQMDCIGTPGVGTGDVLGAAALTHAGAIAKVASAATLTEATAGTDYLAPVATNPQTGATYAILTGDRGKLVTIAYATAQATSIAQAGSTGFPDGWEVTVLNSGAGTATITPATSTIEGAATLVLTTGQAAKIWSNGTNYRASRQGKVAAATLADSATAGSVVVGQKFFGTAAPGSITGNLPGDTFTDTTNHNAYICNAPSGTAAPACTAVAAAGWMLLNDGNTGGATAMTQATANDTDNTVSVSVGTSGRAFEKTPVTIDPSTGAVAGAASYRTAASAAAGLLGLTQGTACTPGTTEVCLYAPASVTSYGIVLPAAVGSSGVLHWGVSSTVATLSSSAVVAADTDTSIAHTGVDINTSHQVTATHLAAGLPIAQGGVVGTTAAVGSVPSASSTSAASWTVTPTIGNPGTASGTWTFGNATGTGTWTVGASPTTTTNTLLGPTAVPTTGHLLDCTTSSTTCTLHDSGVVTANVVNASSPGAGIAHFAGSTQTVTSSAITAAELPATPVSIAATTHTMVAPREYFFCTTATACSVTLPVPAAGYEFCVRSDNNISTAITLAGRTNIYFEATARTGWLTSGKGIVSGAAVTNQICVVGYDSTHYAVMSSVGTWTEAP